MAKDVIKQTNTKNQLEYDRHVFFIHNFFWLLDSGQQQQQQQRQDMTINFDVVVHTQIQFSRRPMRALETFLGMNSE